jgi:hypothetical protein
MPQKKSKFTAESLANTEPKPMEHAVEGLIPLDEMTLLLGRPGSTKTLVLIDFAAQLGDGSVAGALLGQPSVSIYATRENDRARSMKPRCLAAGVNDEYFRHCRSVMDLPAEIEDLRLLIRDEQAKFVVLDPAADYVTLAHSNQRKAKQALQPISDLAREEHVAIVLVLWPNKHGKGLNALAGSIGNSGTARNVLVVGRISVDEYVIGTEKVSDGPDKFGWVYTTEPVEVSPNITSIRIKFLRRALPFEIAQAWEQVMLGDDPAAVTLLKFMEEPSDSWVTPAKEDGTDKAVEDWAEQEWKNNGWFVTADLIDYLKDAESYGDAAARRTINGAAKGKLIDRSNKGRSGEQRVRYRISDLGRSWLQEDEEDSIHAFFRTNERRPSKRPSKRPTKRTVNHTPLAQRALPRARPALPKATTNREAN